MPTEITAGLEETRPNSRISGEDPACCARLKQNNKQQRQNDIKINKK